MPKHLLNQLWPRIKKGVDAAVRDVKFPIESADVAVSFPQLNVSEPFDSFAEAEVMTIGNAFEELTRDAVANLLADLLNGISTPTMDFDRAKELILVHAYRSLDPKADTGFLGSIKRYLVFNKEGFRAKEENFRDVMEALASLAEYFRQEPMVDKKLISALWDICHESGRLIRPDGLWQSEQTKLLEKWIDVISYSVRTLLNEGNLNCRLLMELALEEN
jgi:hypothetical protein